MAARCSAIDDGHSVQYRPAVSRGPCPSRDVGLRTQWPDADGHTVPYPRPAVSLTADGFVRFVSLPFRLTANNSSPLHIPTVLQAHKEEEEDASTKRISRRYCAGPTSGRREGPRPTLSAPTGGSIK